MNRAWFVGRATNLMSKSDHKKIAEKSIHKKKNLVHVFHSKADFTVNAKTKFVNNFYLISLIDQLNAVRKKLSLPFLSRSNLNLACC